MRRLAIPTALGFLLVVVLTACGGNDTSASDQPGTAAVSTDRAQAIAQNMLVAYNSGDYQAFSRDWSSPVKLMVSEHTFRQFRDDSLPATGPFKAITSVTPTGGQQDADHASYTVHATFEQGESALFTLTLSADAAKVEGLEFHPQG
jgi:hypothetical protein